jgi:hypothetical protein
MWGGLLWMSLADGSPDLIRLVATRERLVNALAT